MWLVLFIVCLVLSGVTAFPLETELRFGSWLLHATPFAEWMPELATWIDRVRDALVATNDDYPFLAYGTDWLAFAHLVIAVAFIGPLRDPVRNVWVIQFGMIACVGVIPLALIAGAVRGIPLGWQLLDMTFGVIGIIPLIIVYRLIKRLEEERTSIPHDLKRELHKLPYGATPIDQVSFRKEGGDTVLEFRYFSQGEERHLIGGFLFSRVRATRSQAEGHSTTWHSDGAYCALTEVEDSAWIAELSPIPPTPWPWPIRHFLIYLEDAGAYEVAAESWKWIDGRIRV